MLFEKLSYKIEITNPDQYAKALDVAVRDSLLENIPDYLTFNNDIQIDFLIFRAPVVP